MSKIIGKLKSYKELMGMADDVDNMGTLWFKGNDTMSLGFDNKNKHLCGREINLIVAKDNIDFDFKYNDFTHLKKEWFEWIKEEVNWSKVPVDTKCLVCYKNDNEKYKIYFAGVVNGVPRFFNDGVTSWSTDDYITNIWEVYETYEEEK